MSYQITYQLRCDQPSCRVSVAMRLQPNATYSATNAADWLRDRGWWVYGTRYHSTPKRALCPQHAPRVSEVDEAEHLTPDELRELDRPTAGRHL